MPDIAKKNELICPDCGRSQRVDQTFNREIYCSICGKLMKPA